MTAEKQASRLPQYIAAIAATLGGFTMGTNLGWTSPTKLEMVGAFNMSELDWSWIGGIISGGATIGSIVTGPICDRIGRRTTIIVTMIPSLIGWAMIIWASNTWMVIIGRGILGFVCGMSTVACPMYTNEIAESAIRGTLGATFQLQVTMGILFSYIVGAGVGVTPFCLICAAIPVLQAIFMFFMPESPMYCIKNGDVDSARNGLQKLRGSHYNIDEEISEAQRVIAEIESQKLTITQAFSTTAARKGLCIGLVIMFLQQFSGVNGVIFYASDIFRSAGSSMNENVATIITGVFSVLGTFASTQVIDRLGRKPLLFMSDLFMAISAAILGMFFYLKDNEYSIADNSVVRTIPLIATCVFLVMFSIGFGPIPWMFISEIFPPNTKGPASSIASFFNWNCAFAVSFGFPIIKELLHSDLTFWMFAAISGAGAAFVLMFVPETKGRTVDEVQRILGGRAPAAGPV